MKNLTLLNAPVLTSFGSFEYEPLSVEEVKEIIQNSKSIESAIGHKSTAEFLTDLLGIKVDYKDGEDRITFIQTENDTAIVFWLNKRLGEKQILTYEEIEEIGYRFGLLIKQS